MSDEGEVQDQSGDSHKREEYSDDLAQCVRWKSNVCERKRERGSIKLEPSRCFKFHLLYCKYHILRDEYVLPSSHLCRGSKTPGKPKQI
jgi:hypothetical protein